MIKSIHRLIHICNERKEGYQTASEIVEDPEVKTFFKRLALQSEAFIGELTLLTNAPSSSEVEAPKISDVFTDWMDFKSDITGGDSQGMINSCEVGESHTISAYTEVMENTMSKEVRKVIMDQLVEMKNMLEKLDELKHKK